MFCLHIDLPSSRRLTLSVHERETVTVRWTLTCSEQDSNHLLPPQQNKTVPSDGFHHHEINSQRSDDNKFPHEYKSQAAVLCVPHECVQIDGRPVLPQPNLSILFQQTGYQGQQGSGKLLYRHIIEFGTGVGPHWDQTLLIDP